MTFEEKGAYVDLLMMQFNRGHMGSHMINQLVGHLWDNIKGKFIQDKDGLWYNERLEEEKLKRQRYTQSRMNNILGSSKSSDKSSKKRAVHMDKHMTSHMENENINRNKDINKKEIKDIIDYMNKVFGTNYKHTSRATVQHIHARLDEGFTVNDFYQVIEKKARQWKDDPNMAQYLRPQTLFATKFESYLNQITPKEKSEFEKNIERTMVKYGTQE